MAHLKDLERQLMALKKQIPFATARALTSTARKIQEAQKDNLQSRLDNPTPFTVHSVASTAARKTKLNAKVLIRPTAAEYLAPEEFGGTRHLGGKALLNPKGVRLNKYGNLPKGKLSGLEANPNVFARSVDGASGFWQRKKSVSKMQKICMNLCVTVMLPGGLLKKPQAVDIEHGNWH
ncbi:hypothetical protein BJP41_08160 [Candidatus Williamhamiltonella defendens]|uniref:Uncharacterized protein n=1 Tax=Candidatus Williamhamiltonella defendens TaxID=138072 RepID=A0A2D3T9B6_9ENTR|nr:hypothetical protein [Candidatus Hamiltonella defensa]ATW30290.1 hypothetical protein BJP41_08160 [Candidatus Hamiltonella defensa]ATW32303.1 hypothetical protein BJP42_08460 [Candidatus Hamiltonella defensa]